MPKKDEPKPPHINSFQDLVLLGKIRGGGLEKLAGAKVIVKLPKDD